MIHYFFWQFVLAPTWLLELGWNLQRALVRFFSVPLMVRTLFAHWHKDIMSYRAGGIGGMIMSFLWNQVSRFIGFIVRAITLALWIAVSVTLFVFSVLIFLLFITWPFLIIAGIVWSGVLLTFV